MLANVLPRQLTPSPVIPTGQAPHVNVFDSFPGKHSTPTCLDKHEK